jgi:IS5 family transposase
MVLYNALFKIQENRMRPKPLPQDQNLLFSSRLSTLLNPDHELLKLAQSIPWDQLEAEFAPLFSEGPSRPPLPVRLATGLMILQHVFDVSDERVVAMWVENPYWQAFCGYDFLQWELPVHPTSLTRWRQRIGANGVEKILQASIKTAVQIKAVSSQELTQTISDTTVMPKAVAHPVDAKLVQRSIERIVRIARATGVHLKRSYRRVSRWMLKEYLRLAHGKKFRKAMKPLGKLRKYLGKLLLNLDPHLAACSRELLKEAVIGAKILIQSKEDKNKIYSCHEPFVSCIAKGKSHRPYEFGSKVSLVTSEKSGLALSVTTHLGNPYDGSLLAQAKSRAERNTGIQINRVLVDRGYRGHEVTDAQVLVSYTRGLPKELKKALKRRQAIEPWIGHMKQDGKLGRCHLKGPVGDQIHALLVGVGHNFRLILRKLRIFCVFFLELCQSWLLGRSMNTTGLNAACHRVLLTAA